MDTYAKRWPGSVFLGRLCFKFATPNSASSKCGNLPNRLLSSSVSRETETPGG